MGFDPSTEFNLEHVGDCAKALVRARGLAQSLHDDLSDGSHPVDELVLDRAGRLVQIIDFLHEHTSERQDPRPLHRRDSADLERAGEHARRITQALREEMSGGRGPHTGYAGGSNLVHRHGADPALVRARDSALRSKARLAVLRAAEKTMFALHPIRIDVSRSDLSELNCHNINLLSGFAWTRKTRWPDYLSRQEVRQRSSRVFGVRAKWRVTYRL
ncbi:MULTISPECIES: hypothetical protein [Actinomadura]|uniref:Uncharacterized protein n=1 Tax=Actinomadura yumaensis TaxID=111807 RepID=A0ABW2CF81_9ACTN|nr:hypothetical protein [Actinomadura sp. J1-007]MWK34690.1 hypothetical protein [Actinomadura sp. J1-007]